LKANTILLFEKYNSLGINESKYKIDNIQNSLGFPKDFAAYNQ
jgi:hypothetical protein